MGAGASQPGQPPGLWNDCNSCYANCLIQALASSGRLRVALRKLHARATADPEAPGAEIVCLLREAIEGIQADGDGSTRSIRALLGHAFSTSSITRNTQEDPHELLTLVLLPRLQHFAAHHLSEDEYHSQISLLREIFPDASALSETPRDHLLEIAARSVLPLCGASCSHIVARPESARPRHVWSSPSAFLDISLTLPYRRWSAAAVSLDELIWRHLEPQWVQGYRLDDDSAPQEVEQRQHILLLPRVLVVRISRDMGQSSAGKNHVPVRFPPHLLAAFVADVGAMAAGSAGFPDVVRWLARRRHVYGTTSVMMALLAAVAGPGAPAAGAAVGTAAGAASSPPPDGHDRGLASTPVQEEEQPTPGDAAQRRVLEAAWSTPGEEEAASDRFYHLTAVIEHLGLTSSFGHYVTYRRTIEPATEGREPAVRPADRVKWWRISDDRVEPTSLDAVLRVTPYMLFYECGTVDPAAFADADARGARSRHRRRRRR